MNRKYILISAFIPLLLIILLVKFPEIAFESAYRGLDVWFNIVFPALLPFFIGAQLLMGLGVVHFMGTLMEPLMKPLFNVPGVGSFVVAMGLASGYPIGAILTGELREKKMLTKVEAERLISFTNTADPLFMFGAVAVGMFHNESLGGVIAISHYLSCLVVGLVLRFYKYNSESDRNNAKKKNKNYISLAFQELYKAREKDGRPFGKLLGDCIKNSINTLLLICGFIVLFSVIIDIITVIGFVNVLSYFINLFLEPFRIDITLAPAIISGFFEITLGTKLASESLASPLIQRVMIASAIIAWSGFSVHAQVASMVSKTDINLTPYFFSRLLHAFLAALFTYIIMTFFGSHFYYVTLTDFTRISFTDSSMLNWFILLKSSFRLFIIITSLILISSFILNIFRKKILFIKSL